MTEATKNKAKAAGIELCDKTARIAQAALLPPPSKPKMWRSLDELAQTPEFRRDVEREFPVAASEWDDESSRRTFLKVMGASLALAGVSGCVKQTTEKIVPYVRQPEEMVPGKPLYFATASLFRGYARGILMESHEGRPTKVEGNPDHPASLGSSDSIMQGHVLNLYDPDRSQIVNFTGEVSNWNTFATAIQAGLAARKQNGGQGIRLLTGTITSPTLASQIDAFLKLYPKAKWHQYEPVNNDNEKLGLQQAFGKMVAPIYHFDKARTIVSLDDNFLTDHAGSVRYARDFSAGRRVRPKSGAKAMNRLYVIESTPGIVGAAADERMQVKPTEILNIAREIYAGTGNTPFVKNLLADLNENQGASVVVAGESQPPEVHAIAAALNSKLGNIGKTVEYIEPVEVGATVQTESLRQLSADLDGGNVDLLIILGGNPAYDAPADFDFANKLTKLGKTPDKLTIHLSSHYDETSFICQWHLPVAHELETWSDARAYDGTVTILQPLIAPLYQGKSAHEVLSILLGTPNRTGYEIVQEHWRGEAGADFDAEWNKWLNDGLIAGSAAKPVAVTLAADAVKQTAAPAAGGLEIVFQPDPYLWDGRYANNGWMMEVPRPLTKLVWDNAVLISPTTAFAMKLIDKDVNDTESNSSLIVSSKPQMPVVELSLNGKTVKAPIWILPGQPDDCITVHLGFGRTRAGRIGGNADAQAGFDAYPLRTSGTMNFAAGAQIKAIGESMLLACTQNHAAMNSHGRDLIRVLPIAEEPHPEEKRKVSLSLYPPRPYHDDVREGNKWGMVIDQNACIGCNACVVACQAENNIAVVGKDQVSKGREMHWLRIDAYYTGKDLAEVQGPYFQPVPCMHCENAPCEVVCPANATMHDAEGTNNMVYNRCIGTRYCSNNCPYKVRHFNFLAYTDNWVTSEVQKMVNNPNVTVRSRGVMEKCTYCIQRISAVRITAKKEFVNGQRALDAIQDGEVVTACQQSCPTQAIYFGNINDKDMSNNGKGSVVRELLEEEANYTLLDEDLQTRPRTSYLPRYTNRAGKA